MAAAHAEFALELADFFPAKVALSDRVDFDFLLVLSGQTDRWQTKGDEL